MQSYSFLNLNMAIWVLLTIAELMSSLNKAGLLQTEINTKTNLRTPQWLKKGFLLWRYYQKYTNYCEHHDYNKISDSAEIWAIKIDLSLFGLVDTFSEKPSERKQQKMFSKEGSVSSAALRYQDHPTSVHKLTSRAQLIGRNSGKGAGICTRKRRFHQEIWGRNTPITEQ